MPYQEIIRLLRQTRDLLAFQQELGLDGLPRSAALEAFLQGPAAKPARKAPAAPEVRPAMPPPRREPEPVAPVVSLSALREEVAGCRQCPCGRNPGRISGSGGTGSGLLVILDPPAGDVSAPAAGPAAELLAKMLAAINLPLETVYVTSLLKCPPDGEAAPGALENCLAILRREIAAAAPRVICAMGPLTAATLLRSKEPISVLRGRAHSFHDLPLVPTFHPAYLLKNTEMKKAAWLDLQAIQRRLARR